MASSANANRHNTELAAKAINAKPVQKTVFTKALLSNRVTLKGRSWRSDGKCQSFAQRCKIILMLSGYDEEHLQIPG
jgi:hypothetical protein